MRPPIFLTTIAALALALFPTRAEEPAPPVADSVVVDAPTEAVLNGALRYLAEQSRMHKDPALKGHDNVCRPFRAGSSFSGVPRALPWAGLFSHLWCSLPPSAQSA